MTTTPSADDAVVASILTSIIDEVRAGMTDAIQRGLNADTSPHYGRMIDRSLPPPFVLMGPKITMSAADMRAYLDPHNTARFCHLLAILRVVGESLERKLHNAVAASDLPMQRKVAWTMDQDAWNTSDVGRIYQTLATLKDRTGSNFGALGVLDIAAGLPDTAMIEMPAHIRPMDPIDPDLVASLTRLCAEPLMRPLAEVLNGTDTTEGQPDSAATAPTTPAADSRPTLSDLLAQAAMLSPSEQVALARRCAHHASGNPGFHNQDHACVVLTRDQSEEDILIALRNLLGARSVPMQALADRVHGFVYGEPKAFAFGELREQVMRLQARERKNLLTNLIESL